MYTEEELGRAKRAITIMAKRNHVSEAQIRAELQEASHASFRCNDSHVQAQWVECEFVGSELTPEEFITWLAKKVNARIDHSMTVWKTPSFFSARLQAAMRCAVFCITKSLLQILSETTDRNAGGFLYMKATGIVRRIDDLGRVVIPKEIRRTMRIREGDPSQTTLETWQKFSFSMLDLAKRMGLE